MAIAGHTPSTKGALTPERSSEPGQERSESKGDGSQAVDFYRERLKLWAATFTLLSVTAWIACNAAGVALLGRTWAAQIAHPGNIAALAAPIPLALIWLLCRFTTQSRRALAILDVAGTVLFCVGWTLMSYFAPSAAHPGLDLGGGPSPNPPIGVFANMAALYLRAAVVRRSARRTMVVSSLASAPIVLVAILVARAYRSPEAVSFAIGTTLLSVWTVPGPAIVSWVIYRLRQQVREARQLGQYILEAKIGEGGMGVVYRARHALLRRPTAIKLLRPERTDARDLVRFAREVQQTSRLTHANTIAIYDYGHAADGSFYYAMEYLDGLSLEQLVQHDGPQPPGRVIHIIRQACGALAEAHQNGLVHRDIKPANLHLCVRGGVSDHVKVLDFGLVKEVEKLPSAASNGSRTDVFAGTPLYMSPESIDRPETVDGRADLYALGAMAYYLLTGTTPFDGTTLFEVCGKHLHVAPESPSTRLGRPLPARLEAVVLACLAKRPEERPQSAVALERALVACAGEDPWNEDDASGWWRDRGRTVVAQARNQPAISTGETTIAVDIEGRDQAFGA